MSRLTWKVQDVLHDVTWRVRALWEPPPTPAELDALWLELKDLLLRVAATDPERPRQPDQEQED